MVATELLDIKNSDKHENSNNRCKYLSRIKDMEVGGLTIQLFALVTTFPSSGFRNSENLAKCRKGDMEFFLDEKNTFRQKFRFIVFFDDFHRLPSSFHRSSVQVI